MALFTFHIPAQYFNASHDILRMLSIQIVVQFLFNVVHPSENPFFSTLFFQTLCFVLIGVAFYWLVVHYLIRFTTDMDGEPKDTPTYNPALYTPQGDSLAYNTFKEDRQTNDTKTTPSTLTKITDTQSVKSEM